MALKSLISKNYLRLTAIKKYKYFILFCAVFLSTLLVFNVKTLLLPFILAFLILFFLFKLSLFESIFLTFLLALPFENAIRQWAIYLLPASIPNGYSFFFGVNPKMVLGSLLILLLLIPKSKTTFPKYISSLPHKILLAFFLIVSINSIFFQTRTNVVFMGYTRIVLSLLFYYLASAYFSKPHNQNQFKPYILGLIILCTVIGLYQLVRQRPLGKYIELTPSFSTAGFFTTDGTKQYRVSGFISNPVYFGSFLSILIPIVIGFFWQLKPASTKSKIYWVYLSLIPLSIIVTLGTLSRSTWITLAATLILFYFYHRGHPFTLISVIISKIFSKPIIFFVVAIVLIVPTASLLVTRLGSLSQLFDKGGSIDTRLYLDNESLKMSLYSPLTGIGLNNFTFEQPLEESISLGLPSPPHNTFLIFLVELGIPATLLFTLFIYLSMFRVNPFKQKPAVFSVWVGLITFLISSQIHPLFNLDPTFDLFMLTLGYYSACQT